MRDVITMNYIYVIYQRKGILDLCSCSGWCLNTIEGETDILRSHLEMYHYCIEVSQ
jgi:hypothetical protein